MSEPESTDRRTGEAQSGTASAYAGQWSEQPAAVTESGGEPAPQTGHDQIDRALAQVVGVTDLPLSEQYDRLVTAHAELQQALDTEHGSVRESSDDPAHGTA